MGTQKCVDMKYSRYGLAFRHAQKRWKKDLPPAVAIAAHFSLALSLTHSNKQTNDSDTLDCQSLEDDDDDDDATFVAVQSVQEID